MCTILFNERKPQMTVSRTKKSIINARTALVFYALNFLLSFFSRQAFIAHLGIEVLGLNTTVTSLLGFLNLAELGIGGAISFSLYRPLFRNDIQTINEIVSIQGWLYRKIAFVVMGGGILLMFFFPLIFSKSDLPLWYAYGSFLVLLTSALLGYFVNYRQIVLVADQKEYKITQSIQSIRLVKTSLQIVAISFLTNGYVYWLIIELLAAFITAAALNVVIKKECPYLHTAVSKGNIFKHKYPEIIKKTKQLFFHKIGSTVLGEISPLIIFAYSSLTLVAIYGNYMLIISCASLLFSTMFNSVTAGVGSLVAEGNRDKIKDFFYESFSVNFLFSVTVCFGLFCSIHSFVTLWVGEQYVLDNVVLYILIAILYIRLTRAVVGAFLSAYGLFQDVWATLVEAALNIICFIILGYYWGLTGVVLGVFISLFLMIFLWKTYFALKWGIGIKMLDYFRYYIRHLIVLGIVTGSLLKLFSLFPTVDLSWGNFIFYSMVKVSLFFILMFLCLYASCNGMKQFVKRLYKIWF